MKIRIAAVGALIAALSLGVSASPASAAAAQDKGEAKGRLSVSAKASSPNVARASVSYSVTNALCFSDGITFTAQTQENGFSGVQQFKQTAVEQQFTTSGWQNITPKYVSKSAKFPNDGRNFAYELDWSFSHPVTGTSYRVIWQGFYLNGAGRAIAKTKPVRINCL